MSEVDPRNEQWLRHCEGYRVHSPAGELGTVSEVLAPNLPDRPEAIAITLDDRRSPLLLVGIDEVESVLPAERRLMLRQGLHTHRRAG